MGTKIGTTKNINALLKSPEMMRAQMGPPSRNTSTRKSQVFESSRKVDTTRKGKHIGLSLPHLDIPEDIDVNLGTSSKSKNTGTRASLQTMPV
jgi:hypothetical protein